MLFEIGSWVWLPDEQDFVVPGEVISFTPNKLGKFRLQNGIERKLQGNELDTLQQLDPQCLDRNISNLIGLSNLSENALLHNLRIRFTNDDIYTFVSSILIAVNPFRQLPLYGVEILERYKSTPDKSNLPPHIFSIADNAYKSMINDGTSQSVVISGESGAGKTESTKLILQFLAELNITGSAYGSESNSSIQQQILQCNPVMEAFGNAKTVRNNNSSRFGKLITIRYEYGIIRGASIISYLLEKSRVVHQQDGERNYHFFYQVVAAAADNPELAKSLYFTDLDEHYYISQSSVNVIEGLSDLEQYNEVQSAMEVLGMSNEQQMQVIKTVAGILHLGNIKFKSTDTSGDSAAIIDNDSILPYITNLLGFDQAETRRCLTSKNIGSRSIITCPYTPIQANDARDALSKKLYACLFDWLIYTINVSLEGQKCSSQIFIAVLDIFGFEAFQHNSFEQLCINYCNEKLQYHFNNHIFMMEQAEYAREGVPVEEIKFEDNQPTLDLLELKVTGIFSMIDEEINVPKGSDESLLSKIFQKHNSHAALQRPKSKIHKNVHECFVIVHYAGEVAYNVSGFLEKNKDSLSPDLESLGRNSLIPFISDFFLTRDDSSSVIEMVRPKSVNLKTPRKVKTLGSQFKIQLATLMDTLNSTQPHFVRCMKPNMEKVGRKYDSFVMLYQLRYAGFLEVCRIRQMGYPNRLSFEKFMKLYQILAPQSNNPRELLNDLLQSKKLQQGQCIIGTSKIFLKHSINNKLDLLRDEIYFGHAAKIQKYIRGIIQRGRYRSYKKTLTNLKIAIKEKNLILLEDSIASSVELPNEGLNMLLVKEAKNLLKRLKEENKMNKLLEDAINERQILALESTIKTAKNMNPPLQSLQLTKAIKLLERVKEEKVLLTEATNLIKLKDLKLLENWLDRAESLDLKSNELFKSIQIIVDRLNDERNILEEIQTAIDSENLQTLTAYLTKAIEMGLEGNLTIIQAKKYQIKFENQSTGTKILEVALETPPHIESLQTAIKKATSSGVESNSQIMIKAKRVYDLLNEIQNIEKLLKVAVDKSNIDDIRKELVKAETLQIVIRDDPILSKHNVEIHGIDIANTFINTRSQGDNPEIYQEDLVRNIQIAIQNNDSNYLRSLIAEAKGLGLNKGKYCNLIQEADQIIQKNRLGMEMDMILIAAMKMKDLDSLNQAITNVQSHQLLIPPPSLNSAIKMRDDLMKQTNLIQKIQSAMESKNIDLIFQVVEEAKTINLKNRIIEDGKHILERELIKSQLEKELLETTNQQVLSSVLDKSVQYGITSSVVDNARERYEQIKVNTTTLEDIKFTMKNIEVLRSTEDGIKEDDLTSLKELLQLLEIDEKLKTEEMKNIQKDALQVLKRATKQIELQGKLLEITESTPFTQVKKLIRISADLGLKNYKGFISASIILKELESSNTGRDEIIDEDFEGFNRMKEELYNEARQPNYHFSNYLNLRTAEDFAKGALLNKRKIMEGFLKHQKSSINRSLMKLDAVANNEALIAFKSLLGYCGDKAVSFPASQGLDFVNLGITKYHLRNELYIQAIKQTINAPSPYTQCRAFHILCLLSDAFLPSPDFYLYVVNYFLSHTDKVQPGIDPSSVQQMASYCLIRMQSLKLLPLENQLISIPVETVEAYSARLPTIAPIYTPDNVLLGELLVAPDVGVERLLSIICTLLHINECRKGLLGLYVVTTKSTDLAPMILLPDHDFYIGDICQAPLLQKYGRPIKYYIKRKILDPSSFEKFSLAFEGNEKETKVEREGLIDLTYIQFSSRIISDDIHILDESIVAHLAAINLAIDAQFRPGIAAIALGQGCMKYIPDSHQELQTDEYWGELVAQALFQCVNKSDNVLKLEYIKIVSDLPFGLMHTYICLKGTATTSNNITTKLPEEIFLGLNEVGLHFYNGTNDSNIPILIIRYLELKSYSVRLNSIRFILDGIMENGVKLAYQIELITPANEEISQYCILYRPVQALEAQYSRKPLQSPAEQITVSQSRLEKLSQLRK